MQQGVAYAVRGVLFLYGHGYKPDYAAAQKDFASGRDCGNAEAINSLGVMHDLSLIKPDKPDFAAAIQYYEEAYPFR